MKCSASATGKLILSGEYAVVFGYPGIAVPCSCLGHTTGAIPAPFGVMVTWEPCHTEPVEVRHTLTITHSGIENEEYLHRILDAIAAKTGPRHGHLTIDNTIPIGRGMGSSTALVIAIVRAILGNASCHTERSRSATHHDPHPFLDYARDDTLKDLALSIENTVNPGHSGIDFAVIWEGHPVLFQKKTGASSLPKNSPIHQYTNIPVYWYIIDTGKPNETTAEMVRWVKKNSLSQGERVRVRGALQTIAHCTERLIAGESPLTVFPNHHRAQIALGVVPLPVQALIADIEKIGGAAKVIGAGGRSSAGTKIPSAEPREGGGIVLALHQKPAEVLRITKKHGMPAWRADH